MEVAPNQGAADGDTKDVLVTATIGSDTAQADAVLATTTAVTQTVAKLQYSLDDGTTWQDVPQSGDVGYPLTVNQGDYVDFQAVKSDPNVDWPDGKPVWSGDGGLDGTIGEEAWAYFDTYSNDGNDLKIVTAECYNQLSAHVQVRPRWNLEIWVDDDILVGGSPTNLATTGVWAYVEDQDGNAVPGASVNFNSAYIDGTSAGQLSDNGIAVTDDNGIAQVTLTSGSRISDATITATAADPVGTISGQSTVSFEPPDAQVELGTWEGDGNGHSQSLCEIAVTFNNQPLPNRPIRLVASVQDADGNDVTGYLNAVQLTQTTGVTDADGHFNTILKWVPTDPTLDLNNYNIFVDVYDDSIHN